MDSIDFGNLNYWAIIVAVIFNQALGAAWYAVLARPWMTETGMTHEDMEAMKGTSRAWRPYAVAVAGAVVFTLGLAMLSQGMGAEGVGEGLALGLLAAGGFIFTSNAVTYAFEGRSLRLFLINSGYPLVSYGVIGVLLAVWT